jgi:G3E family GTPase
LVDAETVKTAFEDIYIGDTVQRQLAEAELLIVNKIDLIEGPERISLEDWLTKKAPQARQVPARYAKVPLAAILGGVPRKRPADVADHAVTLFDSLVFRPKADTDAVLLAQALASQQYGVIRAKGFIYNQDGRYMLLQVVGSRWQLAAVPEGSAPHSDCAIICIGLRSRLDKNGLLRLC